MFQVPFSIKKKIIIKEKIKKKKKFAKSEKAKQENFIFGKKRNNRNGPKHPEFDLLI